MAAMTYKAWKEGLADYYCANYGTGRLKGMEAVISAIESNDGHFRSLYADSREAEKQAKQQGFTYDVFSKAAVAVDWRI